MRVKAVIISRMDGATDSRGEYGENLQRGGDLLRIARRADLYTYARDGNRLLRNRWEEEGEQEEQGENSA
jgi:hypothetical protein